MREINQDRFWSQVEFIPFHECWEWAGETLPVKDGGTEGYGRFYLNGGRVLAHRYSYELVIGPIPEGWVVDHLCRNRACVRPEHLEAVTRQENTLRGNTMAAKRAAQTHCLRNHEFTPENTLTYTKEKDGRNQRICRACVRLRS